jgi:hypothetical protein
MEFAPSIPLIGLNEFRRSGDGSNGFSRDYVIHLEAGLVLTGETGTGTEFQETSERPEIE